MPYGQEVKQKDNVANAADVATVFAAKANSTKRESLLLFVAPQYLYLHSASELQQHQVELTKLNPDEGAWTDTHDDIGRSIRSSKQDAQYVINGAVLTDKKVRHKFKKRSLWRKEDWGNDAVGVKKASDAALAQLETLLTSKTSKSPTKKAKDTLTAKANQHGGYAHNGKDTFAAKIESKNLYINRGSDYQSHNSIVTLEDGSISHTVTQHFDAIVDEATFYGVQSSAAKPADALVRVGYQIDTQGDLTANHYLVGSNSSEVFLASLPDSITVEKIKASNRQIVLRVLADIFNHPAYRNQVGGNQQDIDWFRQALTQGFFNPNNPAKAKLIECYRVLYEKGLAVTPSEKAFVNAFEMVSWFESMMVARSTRPLKVIQQAIAAFEKQIQSPLLQPLLSAIKAGIYSVGALHDANQTKAAKTTSPSAEATSSSAAAIPSELQTIPAKFLFPEAGFGDLTLQELVEAAYASETKLGNSELQLFLEFHCGVTGKTAPEAARKQRAIVALKKLAANGNSLEQLQALETWEQERLWSADGALAKELADSYLLANHFPAELFEGIEPVLKNLIVSKQLSDFDLLQILFLGKFSKFTAIPLPKAEEREEMRKILFKKIQQVAKNDCFLSQAQKEHLRMQEQASFLIQTMPVFDFYFDPNNQVFDKAQSPQREGEKVNFLKQLRHTQRENFQLFNIKYSQHLRQPTETGTIVSFLINLMKKKLNYTNFFLQKHYQQAYLFNLSFSHVSLKTALGLGTTSYSDFATFAAAIEILKTTGDDFQQRLSQTVLDFAHGFSNEFQFYHVLRELLETSSPFYTDLGSKLKATLSLGWMGKQFKTKLKQIWAGEQMVALQQFVASFETDYANNLLLEGEALASTTSSSSASTLQLLQKELTLARQSTFLSSKEGNIQQQSVLREVSTIQSDSRHKEAKKHLQALKGHFGSLTKAQKRLQKPKTTLSDKKVRKLAKRELQLMHEQLSLETCRHRGLVK